ncbi:TetR/AcrR family transcriptional regulator [Burkholderia sp. Ac-20353]|nr:TetR/AcrR family transcriptional regulator [Burkholderia sp. Ac-20353]MBN3787328.1 TetR/AcrR family transcriptional regulator [Burkholderia sp. Ac-20353]
MRSSDEHSEPRAKQIRNPALTKEKILAAARAEFSAVGLGGARIDSIAERAGVNKRLIYEYFENKDQLFQSVLEETWSGIREAEAKLDLNHLSPTEAIKRLMTFTWDYYLANPDFMSLVNSANLHKARHIVGSKRFKELHVGFIDMLQDILDRGVATGEFRPGVDARQLHITLAAIAYYYLNNRYTNEVIFGFSFVDKEKRAERLAFNIDTVLRLLAP